VTVFASGTYLANPRNTNGHPSIISGLGVAVTPANANRLVNSVPDQYFARVGVALPAGLRGLGASIAVRMEGQPRYDLIGRSDGFRRPGTEMFLEPGLTFVRGNSTWSAGVPIAFYSAPRPLHGGAWRRDVPEFHRARWRLGPAREIGGRQRAGTTRVRVIPRRRRHAVTRPRSRSGRRIPRRPGTTRRGRSVSSGTSVAV
jgi:hypothetical protein